MGKMVKKDSLLNKKNAGADIYASPKLISELFAQKLISEDARNYSFQFLVSSKDWGLWVGRFFLIFGMAFILWALLILKEIEMSRLTKLGSIQLVLLACLGVSCFCYSRKFLNNILILASAVLVGIFLMTFADLYHTESNSYSLFMVWMILILPWTLVCNFPSLWALWLVIVNVFCILYWKQALFMMFRGENFTGIYPYLALFNSIFLALREYGVRKGITWLEPLWTREVLTVSVLVYIMMTLVAFIVVISPETLKIFDVVGAAIAAILGGVIYAVYRFKLPDFITSLTAIFLGCIIICIAMFKILVLTFSVSVVVIYLIEGIITVTVFSIACIAGVKLCAVTNQWEDNNV